MGCCSFSYVSFEHGIKEQSKGNMKGHKERERVFVLESRISTVLGLQVPQLGPGQFAAKASPESHLDVGSSGSCQNPLEHPDDLFVTVGGRSGHLCYRRFTYSGRCL